MKLTLKNIGKISEADVEINGITVIAGENNSGKSTIGKALFAVFNSFYNVRNQIKNERIDSVDDKLNIMYRNATSRLTRRFDTNEIAQELVENIDFFKEDQAAIESKVINAILQNDENFIKFVENEVVQEMIMRIKDTLNVSDFDFFKSVLEKRLDAEFNGQVNNIYNSEMGEIKLQIKEEEMTILIQNNIVKEIKNNIDLHTEAIYIDDPFIIDDKPFPLYSLSRMNNGDHRNHLRTKLFFSDRNVNIVEEIVTNSKFENIFEKLSVVCSGEIVKHKSNTFGYKKSNSDKILSVRNLSTGLKTFVLLKKLLTDGMIDYNGTIILDEPEIHLHPEWQLVFAELIVLIQKEFGMHILLNTHSPYFLRAIQVYSAKYSLADKCKYYFAENLEDFSTITDVTENIDKIYQKLSYPLQKLEDERWSDD